MTRLRPSTIGLALAAAPVWSAPALAPAPGHLAWKVQDLLGIPYVDDAGLDERGNYARFAHPDQVLTRPGLNCSGFLVAAARRLLGFAGSLTQATGDRLGDSGPGAKGGLDWDFGWDLVLNLSEGHPRRWVLAGGDHPAPGGSARALSGFRVQDREAWARLAPRWQSDWVYLATLQRGAGPRLRHHHVALLLKDATGGLGYYQTLPGGRVHRLALDTKEGLDRLCTMFGPGEWILVLEVQP